MSKVKSREVNPNCRLTEILKCNLNVKTVDSLALGYNYRNKVNNVDFFIELKEDGKNEVKMMNSYFQSMRLNFHVKSSIINVVVRNRRK